VPHTILRRATPSGGLFRQIVGLPITPLTTSLVVAASLFRDAGFVPAADDLVRDDEGNWGIVTGATLNEGEYTITLGG
jgi:hypothetical protein